MDSLPARGGAAARLAHLLHERGLHASIKPAGRALLLTIRNPQVPFGKLAQQVALVPHDEHGERTGRAGRPCPVTPALPGCSASVVIAGVRG